MYKKRKVSTIAKTLHVLVNADYDRKTLDNQKKGVDFNPTEVFSTEVYSFIFSNAIFEWLF